MQQDSNTIPHFDYSENNRDGRFVILFIHVPSKNAKPFDPLQMRWNKVWVYSHIAKVLGMVLPEYLSWLRTISGTKQLGALSGFGLMQRMK